MVFRLLVYLVYLFDLLVCCGFRLDWLFGFWCCDCCITLIRGCNVLFATLGDCLLIT